MAELTKKTVGKPNPAALGKVVQLMRSVDQAQAGGAEPFIVTAFGGDISAVIKCMRSGVSASVVPAMAARFGISQDALLDVLRLPRSTMKARISKNESLSATELDRVYRADKVWSRVVEVLDDSDAARSWINRPNRALGGEAPLSLLDTEAGYELVMDTLGRIAYGVVS